MMYIFLIFLILPVLNDITIVSTIGLIFCFSTRHSSYLTYFSTRFCWLQPIVFLLESLSRRSINKSVSIQNRARQKKSKMNACFIVILILQCLYGELSNLFLLILNIQQSSKFSFRLNIGMHAACMLQFVLNTGLLLTIGV